MQSADKIVIKFGGSSLATKEKIMQAARLVCSMHEGGVRVFVVVSALFGVTDELISQFDSLADVRDGDVSSKLLYERDAIVSCGENISAALFATAIMKFGYSARSWQAWQLPIQTDSYPNPRIRHIDIDALEGSSSIPILCGFQGVNNSRVTTIGRGGSDATAIALAHHLGCNCIITTDVAGVYSADPKLVPRARIIPKLTFSQMFELSHAGAKVLQLDAAKIASEYKVDLSIIASSQALSDGTRITMKPDEPSKDSSGILAIVSRSNGYFMSSYEEGAINAMTLALWQAWGCIVDEKRQIVIAKDSVKHKTLTNDKVGAVTIIFYSKAVRDKFDAEEAIGRIKKYDIVYYHSKLELSIEIFCAYTDTVGLMRELHRNLVEVSYNEKKDVKSGVSFVAG